MFCPNDNLHYLLDNYIKLKDYNSSLGDLLPLITANALRRSIFVIDWHSPEYKIFSINPRDQTTLAGFLLIRQDEHYNAVIRQELVNIYKQPGSREDPSSTTDKLIKARIDTNYLNPPSPIKRILNMTIPNLYVLNAASLAKPHAIDHLYADLSGYNIDIAIISETHFKEKHPNKLFELSGYDLFRRDRRNRRGGGVAIFGKTDLQMEPWETKDNSPTYEIMWTRFKSSKDIIFMGAAYHPPKPSYSPESFITYMEQSIENIEKDFPVGVSVPVLMLELERVQDVLLVKSKNIILLIGE